MPALPPTTVAFRSRTCVNQSSLLRHFVLAGDRGLGLKFARVASGAAGTGGLEFGVGLGIRIFQAKVPPWILAVCPVNNQPSVVFQ